MNKKTAKKLRISRIFIKWQFNMPACGMNVKVVYQISSYWIVPSHLLPPSLTNFLRQHFNYRRNRVSHQTEPTVKQGTAKTVIRPFHFIHLDHPYHHNRCHHHLHQQYRHNRYHYHHPLLSSFNIYHILF